MRKLLTGLLMHVFAAQVTLAAEVPQALHAMPGKQPAPAFVLQDLDDKPHKLADYRGKVVILNFWATWCPPCRYEFPSMEKAYQKLKKEDIVMLAVDVGEDTDTIFDFTADYPVTFPILLDFEAKVINAYKVIGLPTTYVIDPDGILRYQVIGTRDWEDPALLDGIRRLKNKSGKPQ